MNVTSPKLISELLLHKKFWLFLNDFIPINNKFTNSSENAYNLKENDASKNLADILLYLIQYTSQYSPKLWR